MSADSGATYLGVLTQGAAGHAEGGDENSRVVDVRRATTHQKQRAVRVAE